MIRLTRIFGSRELRFAKQTYYFFYYMRYVSFALCLWATYRIFKIYWV